MYVWDFWGVEDGRGVIREGVSTRNYGWMDGSRDCLVIASGVYGVNSVDNFFFCCGIGIGIGIVGSDPYSYIYFSNQLLVLILLHPRQTKSCSRFLPYQNR